MDIDELVFLPHLFKISNGQLILGESMFLYLFAIVRSEFSSPLAERVGDLLLRHFLCFACSVLDYPVKLHSPACPLAAHSPSLSFKTTITAEDSEEKKMRDQE